MLQSVLIRLVPIHQTTITLFAGSTQYSRAEFNEPFGKVYWYVRGPGETGFGTLVYTDYGDGASESSQFSHTFSNGSTSGEEYEITAYVYPLSDAADQRVDWDSYTVGVFTPLEEVLMVPDELAITDDIKLNDNYAFNVDVSSSDSNYVIRSMEVYVDGDLNTSRSFSDVSSASLSAAGFLNSNGSSSFDILGKIKVAINSKFARRLTGQAALIYHLDVSWRALLVGTIYGDCWCPNDNTNLTNSQSYYTCTDPNTTYVHFNVTFVKWNAPNVSNAKGSDGTTSSGRYSFSTIIPLAHEINLTMKSEHLHNHECADGVIRKRLCKYSQTKALDSIGKVFLKRIPLEWEQKRVDFNPVPQVYDPCVAIKKHKRL